jgi:hypothetical protein
MAVRAARLSPSGADESAGFVPSVSRNRARWALPAPGGSQQSAVLTAVSPTRFPVAVSAG